MLNTRLLCFVQVIDSVIQVNDKDAFQTCHELARREGLMVGGSAGLNVFAAVELANSMKVTKNSGLA